MEHLGPGFSFQCGLPAQNVCRPLKKDFTLLDDSAFKTCIYASLGSL